MDTSLCKSILLPQRTKNDSSLFICLIKFIHVIILVKVFLFEISYTINIIDAPFTYEGIKAL